MEMKDIYKVSQFSGSCKKDILEKIYFFLKSVENDYPRHDEWIKKVFDRILLQKNDRDILFLMNGTDIIGCAVLKNTIAEKKICTLKVDEKFSNRGLAQSLIANSIELLNCQNPIITVPENKIHLYYNLLRKFNFSIVSQYKDRYTLGSIEYVFNGYLEKNTLLSDLSFDCDFSFIEKRGLIISANC